MALDEQMQTAIQEDIADTRSKEDRLKDQMEGLTRMGVSAVASPILGAGDIVDVASSIPEMPPKAAVMFPTIAGLQSGFNAAKQAGLDREKAEELIEYITGVELQGDSVELFGEIVGIPGGASVLKGVTNIIKKYGDTAPKYINEIKAEAKELFRTASGGDDIDGASPALIGPSIGKSVSQQTDEALPDTSITPTIVGEDTAIGQRAAKRLEELEESHPRLSPEEMFDITGAYRGVDGKVRTEIDTTLVEFQESFTEESMAEAFDRGQELALSDILDFDELYKAYDEAVLDDMGFKMPRESSMSRAEIEDARSADSGFRTTSDDIKEINVLFDESDPGIASYNPRNDTITLGAGFKTHGKITEGKLAIILHEVQHGVQHRAGFETGANSRRFIPTLLEEDGFAQVGIRNSRQLDDKIVLLENSIVQTEPFGHFLGKANQEFKEFTSQGPARQVDTAMVLEHIFSDIVKKRIEDVPYDPRNPFKALDDKKFNISENDIDNFFKIDNTTEDGISKLSTGQINLILDIGEKQNIDIDDIDAETLKSYKALATQMAAMPDSSTKISNALSDSINSSRELNALKMVNRKSTANYFLKYGELEARMVENRFTLRRKLKKEGMPEDEIRRRLNMRYPMEDFTATIMDAAALNYVKLPDEFKKPVHEQLFKPYDQDTMALPPQLVRGVGPVEPEALTLQRVIKPEFALTDAEEDIMFAGKQAVEKNAKQANPLEIGTSPATEGGALLANYTADTAKDLTEKAKNATVSLNKELMNKFVDKGKQVAIRLNLNSSIPDAPKGLDKLQTLHDKKPSGAALSYVPFATVENVDFFVNQTGRRNIASKIKGLDVKEATGKFPAMSVNGQYNPTRNVLDEMDDDVVEIGFNPANSHLFVDMATGQAVKSAEVATVIGNRVYAKGVTYMKKAEAPKPKPASDGTPLDSEVRYKFKKGGAVPMKKQMELFEPVEGAFDEGGLMDEGGTVDPESGNDVPAGSTQEEVRDDIPAQLSEGEFVLPADVVRYHGLEKIMALRDEAKAGLAKMEAMGQMGNSEEATIPDGVPFSMDDLDMEDDGMLEYAEGGVVNAQVGAFIPQQPPTGVQFMGGGQRQSQSMSQPYTPPSMMQPQQQPLQPYQYQAPQQAITPTYNVGTLPSFGDVVSGGGGATGAAEVITIVNKTTGEKRQINFIPGVTQIPEGFVRESEYTPTEKPKVETTTTPSTRGVQQGGDDDDGPTVPSTTDASGIAYDRGKIENKGLRDALAAAGFAQAKDVGPAIAGLFTGSVTGVLGQAGKKAAQGMGFFAGNKQHAGAVLGGVLDEFRGASSGMFDTGRQVGSYTNTTALDQLSNLQQQMIADTFKSVTEKMKDMYTKEEVGKDGKTKTVTKSQAEIMETLRTTAGNLGIKTTFTDRRGREKPKRQTTLERQIASAYAKEIGQERLTTAKTAAERFGINTAGKSAAEINEAVYEARQEQARQDAAAAEQRMRAAGHSYGDDGDSGGMGGFTVSDGQGGTYTTDSSGTSGAYTGGPTGMEDEYDYNKGGLAQQMKQSGLASKK